MLEQMLQANLMEKYNQEEIDQFNLSFKDNSERYTSINSDAAETLCGFIDFD
jgi:hypothetical protein